MPLYAIQSVLVGLLCDLTPHERYQAMRQLDTGGKSLFTDKWSLLLGWSLIFFLTVLLLAVRRMRIEKEKRQIEDNYDALSDKLHLTAEEREILDAITARSGLPQKDDIFAHPEAFENGLASLMKDVFADGHNLVYRKKLQAAVYSIKQKLGYIKPVPAGRPHSGKVQSSRHIPVGKAVRLSLSGKETAKQIRAEVIVNDPYELVVAPEFPLASQSGQVWTVQYNTGSVTWEFEAITLTCTERGLELNHSDRIRFVNRRRFPRVAVRKDGVIARFPVFRSDEDERAFTPVFFDAHITEISGPGLRIHTELEPAIAERVLVAFELEPGRIVQDIGQVRDVRQTPTDRAVIVELSGLGDRAVDELVRITNQLAGRTRAEAEAENSQLLAEII